MKTNPEESIHPTVKESGNYMPKDSPIEPLMVTGGGLTKREYFAACALQGIMADPTINDISGHKLAEHAVRLADALIVALNKEQG